MLKNISSIVTPYGNAPRRGEAQGKVALYKGYSISIKGDRIAALIPALDVDKIKAKRILNCEGCTAIPGLVDAHTHIPFLNMRTNEFYERMNGVSYTEIARKGGGIISTVKDVRSASEEQIYEAGKKLLNILGSHGVTTVECKTGYGLTREDEIKEARVIERLSKDVDMEVVGTFLGAHAVPVGWDKDRYIDEVIDTMKEIRKIGIMKFVDIFCDEGAFNAEDLKKVLLAGKANGFIPRAHVNEIASIGGVEVAVKINCRSVDHVRILSAEEIKTLALSNTTVVVLPMTTFFLNMDDYTPARKLIDEGVPVAMASDFNPGSCMLSNPFFAMALGVIKMRMTPEECLTAYTLNAAYVLGLHARIGSIEVGKQADILLLRTPTFRNVIPIFDENTIMGIVKRGKIKNGNPHSSSG